MNQELKNLQTKYAINLFDWYDFKSKNSGIEKDVSVLIIGDVDDNFIFPFSKKVGHLSIVIETKEIERLISYQNLPNNVTVYNDFVNADVKNAWSIKECIDKLDEKLKGKVFDYCLVPSLTEKVTILTGKNLYDAIKFLSNKYTGGKGTIIFAFDNKYSLNVIAGAKLEDNVQAYSIEDIDKAYEKLKAEFTDSFIHLYYPMPEYKFPLKIYSDKYLPKVEDENDIARNLVKLGKFREYCFSYILIFDAKKSFDNEYETIYVKYNLNRAKRFALMTSILETKDKVKKVLKKAVYNEANSHIKDMVENVNIIKNANVEVLKAEKYVPENNVSDGKAYVIYDFIEGEALTDYILKRIKNGENEKEVISEYMLKLIGKISGVIENYNLDCTFQNAIIKDKKIYVIDSEWISKDSTEVNFLRYRILKYFYKNCKQYLSYSTFKDLIRDFGIEYSDSERYENAENEFQTRVHENINNLDVSKYEELNPDFAKLYYVKAELERVKAQLDRITGENNVVDYQANKQNEIIRLTNVHVCNLETMIENLKSQVGALTEQNTLLFKREGLFYKVIRKIKRVAFKLFPQETIRNKIVKYIYRTIRHPFKMLKTYFTRNGRNRIVGDFMIGDVYFECGKVSLPKCENPKVSIIIPCFNQIRYTYKCLYSIMINTDKDKTPYEVIIADDVSTDTTRNISKYVDNIKVSRNTENLGFLKNCNNAAKMASGEYIYFLNNDTEVKPGYLSSLVDLIESDKDIGMVGSKLIYADGTLQEAGGIIWSDGKGANYGRGDNPSDFKYNYVKEVDYISGASIMIRKNLWNIIGGFDERFAPAYSEDSDLAFEVRKYGYKVMYQPKSEIIHFEGKSCGTDVNDKTSVKSYQEINNEKLKEKWEKEFINQFPHVEQPNFFRARERAMDKKTILFIDHYVPTWDKDAGSKTVFSYMMMFKNKGYSVKFLGDNFGLNSPYGDELQKLGIEVLYGNNLQATIWEYLKENKRNFDFIFLNRPHIAIKYIDFIRQNMFTKIIYYGHDLHYLRLQREYDLTGDENALYESKYFRNLEYSLLYKSDMSYYPSYKEVEEIKNVDDTLRVKSINAYIFDKKEIVYRDFNNTKDLLFVGGFAHEPNIDAIRWFHKSIMPRVKASNSSINLKIVGSNATEEVKNICREGGYELLGFVSDEELKKLYKETRIVVAPLRYGAGIKGKIVEAMANGAAIITTTCGAEGIYDAEYFMSVVEDAQDFSQEIVKLYGDIGKLESFSLESQKIINRKFTIDAAWDIVKEDF